MAVSLKGIDIRQAGSQVIVEAFLTDAAGDIITAGTTEIRLYRVENDQTLLGYDFASPYDFSSAPADDEGVMAHQVVNSIDSGIWTFEFDELGNWVVNDVYVMWVYNSTASPTTQTRKFQYGGGQGADVMHIEGVDATDQIIALLQQHDDMHDWAFFQTIGSVEFVLGAATDLGGDFDVANSVNPYNWDESNDNFGTYTKGTTTWTDGGGVNGYPSIVANGAWTPLTRDIIIRFVSDGSSETSHLVCLPKGWDGDDMLIRSDGSICGADGRYPGPTPAAALLALGVGSDGRVLSSIDVQPNLNLQPAVGDDNISRQQDVSNISTSSGGANKEAAGDNTSAPIGGVTFVVLS